MMNSIYAFPPRKILVPTDMSAASKAALQYAGYFHKNFGSSVRILHSHHFALPPYFSSGQVGELKRELRKVTRSAEEYVRKEVEAELGFRADIKIVDDVPDEAILDFSRQNDIDLIIMGMHGYRGAKRLLLGSVTERVIQQSTVPVLAVRTVPADPPIQRILCPINPSEAGKNALHYAAEMSRILSAHLTVLHVVEPGDEPLACPLVDDQIKRTCKLEEVNLHGNAARTIAETANKMKPDLTVMGGEHKSGIFGEFFSSTTSSVMQLASIPLVVVPSGSR